MLYFVEGLDWIDLVYISAFKTLAGRLFAGVWLLISTLAVARAFLYLAEARVDKRHRRIANKSEYVIYKLKEMGKIGEKDILEICDQFNKLDPNNSSRSLGKSSVMFCRCA
ncbi:hypothetical protein V6N11_025521 [Hibiscus sabdariffa]|uniref:Uncharacterized protein n=1 Tax=Hibiscus sabdariffa TaxID=183260 RepID=A0ABR2NJ73_9ROSI